MNNCIFCDILAGEEPVSIVYQDDTCTAFMDLNPVNRGHTLVVPNRHATYLADLDTETAGAMMQVALKVAAAIRASDIRSEGVNLFLADGEAAGQEVFHVHLHVLPRFEGDGFGLKHRPDYPKEAARSELDAVAAALRDALS